jgi:hypothetical protein
VGGWGGEDVRDRVGGGEGCDTPEDYGIFPVGFGED